MPNICHLISDLCYLRGTFLEDYHQGEASIEESNRVGYKEALVVHAQDGGEESRGGVCAPSDRQY
jgi:hypothetical protein